MRPVGHLLAFALAAAVSLCGCGSEPEGRISAAAVAIRDVVPGYQQLGTRAFTLRHLPAYASYTYLEETPEDGPGGKRAAFAEAVAGALAKHDHVDLFLLAHANDYHRAVAGLDPALRSRLRLVYDTGGASAADGPRWLELGARAFVGHPGDNLAPIFYVEFLPAWLSGRRLDEVLAEANATTRERILTAPVRWAIEEAYGDAGPTPDLLWAGTQARLFGDPSLTCGR